MPRTLRSRTTGIATTAGSREHPDGFDARQEDALHQHIPPAWLCRVKQFLQFALILLWVSWVRGLSCLKSRSMLHLPARHGCSTTGQTRSGGGPDPGSPGNADLAGAREQHPDRQLGLARGDRRLRARAAGPSAYQSCGILRPVARTTLEVASMLSSLNRTPRTRPCWYSTEATRLLVTMCTPACSAPRRNPSMESLSHPQRNGPGV